MDLGFGIYRNQDTNYRNQDTKKQDANPNKQNKANIKTCVRVVGHRNGAADAQEHGSATQRCHMFRTQVKGLSQRDPN